MYAVVGCSECRGLWVIEGDPDTSECPRCGSRRPRSSRREFFRSEDADAARQARSRLLAERQGEQDAFGSMDAFADLEAVLEDAGPDDETYLAESGLDPDAIAEAGDRATESRGSQSRRETVLAALRDLEEPDQTAVAEYCAERGVEREAATDLLERLVRAGEATRRDGFYRLL